MENRSAPRITDCFFFRFVFVFLLKIESCPNATGGASLSLLAKTMKSGGKKRWVWESNHGRGWRRVWEGSDTPPHTTHTAPWVFTPLTPPSCPHPPRWTHAGSWTRRAPQTFCSELGPGPRHGKPGRRLQACAARKFWAGRRRGRRLSVGVAGGGEWAGKATLTHTLLSKHPSKTHPQRSGPAT